MPAVETLTARSNKTTRKPPSALADPGSHARLWTVAVAALALDLWSKAWAFDTLGPSEVRTFIPSILSFRRSTNPGALFGMGKGLVPLFIVASLVALVFVLYLFAASTPKRKSLHLALSLVLAGSLGNLYDRVFIIADRIALPGEAPLIGKIIDDDGVSEYLTVGSAPDGANPRRVRRAGAQITQVGVVRDFLKFEPKIGRQDLWPWVFNVADSLLVVGVAILMINLWFERKAERGDQPQAASISPLA